MTSLKAVPITAETVVDQIPTRKLGTTLLTLPEGQALCTDAVSLTQIIAQDAETGERFIVVIGVGDFDGDRFGSLSPMTPNEARNFAASLIKGANEIDGGANG